jgi:hypothetical protein
VAERPVRGVPGIPGARLPAAVEEEQAPVGGRWTHPGRSLSPVPGTDPRLLPAIEREVRKHGDELRMPPESAPPPPSATPLYVQRPAHVPWWHREDGVAKVLGALGALIAGTVIALGTYRATAPAPPPPKQGDIECPPFSEGDAPRGALCHRLHALEGMVGKLQAEEHARKAAAERERKMLEQEPQLIKPKAGQ